MSETIDESNEKITSQTLTAKGVDIKAELKTSFDQHMLMEQNIDQALSFLLKISPLDVIQPKLDATKPENVPDAQKRMQQMSGAWLDMYGKLLEEGSSIPVDLIGRAAELARDARKKKNEK